MKRYIRSSYKGGTGNPDEWDYSVIRPSGEPKLSRKIYKGLQWDMNGHLFEVVKLLNNISAVVTEDWISEDTGKELHQEKVWDIKNDNRSQFVCPEGNINYRLHAIDADNSAEVREYEDSFAEYDDPESKFEREYGLDEDEDEPDEYDPWGDDWDDEYTPSATRGDYSPSHPWDAPGMSIKDFI